MGSSCAVWRWIWTLRSFCSAHYTWLRWPIDQLYQESGRGKSRLISKWKEGGKEREEGSCELLQGTDSTWLAGSCGRESLSMLQGHLMGLDVALIAKTPWGRQRKGLVQMKPVFNSPLSFLTQNELFWHQFYTSKKAPHYQSYSKQLLPTRAARDWFHQRNALLLAMLLKFRKRWGSFSSFQSSLSLMLSPSRKNQLSASSEVLL